MKLFNFEKLFDGVSTQVIWLLAIVAIVMAVCAYATQGFARSAFTIIGVFLLIMLILLLANAMDIGQWLKDQIWIGNDVSDATVQTILPFIRLM
jgi:ABC-type multidrug transport system permease subunit